MELKEFVKKVILDLDGAISEANSEAQREIRFKGYKGERTAVEFDIAVTVESSESSKGGGGIQVWGLGLEASHVGDSRDSVVSRVCFGVGIDEKTKTEKQSFERAYRG